MLSRIRSKASFVTELYCDELMSSVDLRFGVLRAGLYSFIRPHRLYTPGYETDGAGPFQRGLGVILRLSLWALELLRICSSIIFVASGARQLGCQTVTASGLPVGILAWLVRS